MSLTLYLNEEDGGHFSFDAEARVGQFTGHTNFWVSRTDLEHFLDELDQLDRALHGEASIRCGWGEEVYFGLHIRPEGPTGRLLVELKIASPAEADRFHRLHTCFVLPEPNALTRFRTALRAAQVGSEGPAAVLTPAFAPAGA